MALIFQYGSNTSTARINAAERLGGDAKVIGLVRTRECFQLEFSVWSRTNGCAAASLAPGGRQPIWGVLYEIADALVFRGASPRRTLDQIESEGVNYLRTSIEVLSEPNAARTALTYIAKEPRRDIRTNARYASHVLRGLKEHGAPLDYLHYVRTQIQRNNPALTELIAPLVRYDP